MHKQLSGWEFLLQQLRDEQPVMLMYVIESSGSSPGRHTMAPGISSLRPARLLRFSVRMKEVSGMGYITNQWSIGAPEWNRSHHPVEITVNAESAALDAVPAPVP